MEAREYIISKIDAIMNKQFSACLFSVALFWRGPFNDFNEKVVFFENYSDCMIYADELNVDYSDYDFPFLLYVNGGIKGWNKETELTKLAIPDYYKEKCR